MATWWASEQNYASRIGNESAGDSIQGPSRQIIREHPHAPGRRAGPPGRRVYPMAGSGPVRLELGRPEPSQPHEGPEKMAGGFSAESANYDLPSLGCRFFQRWRMTPS